MMFDWRLLRRVEVYEKKTDPSFDGSGFINKTIIKIFVMDEAQHLHELMYVANCMTRNGHMVDASMYGTFLSPGGYS